MSAVLQEFRKAVGSSKNDSVKKTRPRHKTTRDCPRVTLRFSLDDYDKLKQLAGSMSLATYIRAKALSEDLPRRKHHSAASMADKQLLSQILGLLGQSRIANNLNQLAYHANIGSLEIDEDTKAQILEAYGHVVFLRKILVKALGLRE